MRSRRTYYHISISIDISSLSTVRDAWIAEQSLINRGTSTVDTTKYIEQATSKMAITKTAPVTAMKGWAYNHINL